MDTSATYQTFRIPKRSGGYREINAPQGKTAERQQVILYTLLYRFSAHPIAHGFTKNRSPVTNASYHIGAKILVKLDIKDFFPSLTEGKVRKMFEYLLPMCNDASSWDIDELVSAVTYKGNCPQGACTSPAIGNLVLLGMDKQLQELQHDFNCVITRYADDIVCSSRSNMDLPKIIPVITKLFSMHGFRLNRKKVKVQRRHRRMSVTGVVVNEKQNIARDKRRNLRAQLHNLKGKTITQKEFQVLSGKVAWAKQLNPHHGEKLEKQLELIYRN